MSDDSVINKYLQKGDNYMFEKESSLGSVNVSNDVVATIVGGAVTECYGVVGMASQKMLKDGWYELLKKENFSRGVVIESKETGIKVDLYVIIGYGMKISEVTYEIQKKVKYVLETTLDVEVDSVNVFVQGISVVE